MNTLKILNIDPRKNHIADNGQTIERNMQLGSGGNYKGFLLVLGLILFWPMAQHLITGSDPTIGFIDPNIWLLLLLSLIAFLVTTGLCWWLLQKFWTRLGLPDLGNMVLQFKDLSAWQQLGFYWLSFGLLLLAAVGVLSAIV